MKRTVLLPALAAVFVAAGCAQSVRFENFADCQEAFSEIADAAQDYYALHKNDEEYLTLDVAADAAWARPELEASMETVKDAGMSYLWVSDDYVIFWEDETKQYGVLYSGTARDVIASIKEEWYAYMEYQRLDGDWYEIGQLNAL